MSPQDLAVPAAGLVVLGAVLLRSMRPHALYPGRMWIAPTLVIGVVGTALYFTPQRSLGPGAWAAFAAALLLGGLGGWWRGKAVHIQCEPDGRLTAQATPLGLIAIAAVLAARGALGLLVDRFGPSWRFDAAAAGDTFLIFAGALVVAQRVEMWTRARRLWLQVRTNKRP